LLGSMAVAQSQEGFRHLLLPDPHFLIHSSPLCSWVQHLASMNAKSSLLRCPFTGCSSIQSEQKPGLLSCVHATRFSFLL
jgi:hypothetical protein